jgi:CubicO group peptidase (beta-lactamase class C family)
VLDGVKPANSAAVRVNLVPGSQWRYSGGGFTAMQLVMTDVTGTPFPALMRELVLDRIGMQSSTYEQPLSGDRMARAAAGHRATGDVIPGKRFVHPEMAAAGLWTTPSDLARFAIELQQAYAGKSERVLSAAMANQMLTKQAGEYGLGVGLGGSGGTASFSHGGSNVGFKCMLFAYVHSGQGAVVMTNGDLGAPLATEILRSLSREYGWPDYKSREVEAVTVAAAVLQSYVGTYALGGTVVVTLDGARLFVQPPGQSRVELLPVSETEFLFPDRELRVRFIRGAQGTVDEVALVGPDGQEQTGKRVKVP